MIPGSHRSQSLSRHRHNPSENLTLHEELLDTEFNSANATNIVLERGQISLHDVYLMHGSKPNMTEKDRRGITMRMMPTTSLYDRNVAAEQDEARGRKYGTKIKFSENPIFLMRGIDQCGKNEFCYVPALCQVLCPSYRFDVADSGNDFGIILRGGGFYTGGVSQIRRSIDRALRCYGN